MDTNRAGGNINIGGSSRAVLGNVYQELNFQIGGQPQQVPKSRILLNSLTFDRWDARQRDISIAHSRTCEWLFAHEMFQSWLDAQQIAQNGGFLWLKGKPGSGKSTLMKRALEWTKRTKSQQHKVINYFFNARSPHELEKSSLGLYRSITHQILTAWPEAIATFTQIFSSKERDGKMVEEWHLVELHNFLIELTTNNNLPPFIVFIDALDEGEEDDIRQMIDALVDLTQRSWSMNNAMIVCLSSRHYPTITIDKTLSIVLEDQYEHQQDIELYISEKLRGGSEPLMQDLRRQMLHRSQGVFLWTVLVVPILNGLYDKGYSTKRRAKQLEQVPQRLYDVFNDLILRDPESFQECISLLQWVLFSLRPLTPREICGAVEVSLTSPEELNSSLDADDCELLTTEAAQRRILHYSRGLAEVSKGWTGQSVQFIHETVRDFLLRRNESNLGSVDLPAFHSFTTNFHSDHCHIKIAIDCLRYLIALTTDSKSSEAGLDKNSFANYAAKYWWRHIGAATSGISKNTLPPPADLCGTENRSLTKVRYPDSDGRQKMKPSVNPEQLYLPLYYAYKSSLLELIEILVARDDDINSRAVVENAIVLWEASESGYEKVVQILLEAGVDVNIRTVHNSTALHAASYKGHEKVVQILLDAEADVSLTTVNNETALQMASSGGHEKIVQMLLDAGAEVNNKRKFNEAVLAIGSLIDQDNVMQILIDSGEDIDDIAEIYGTALQKAYLEGHETLQTLLDAGADIGVEGACGETALYAASYGGHEKVVQTLLDAGVDVNVYGGSYGTALHAASMIGHSVIVQMLLDAGADVEAAGRYYGSALAAASGAGCENTVQMLINAGADINAEGAFQGSALCAASLNGHEETLQILLDAGADVDAEGGTYGTALHAASLMGNENIVQMLLKAGANVCAKGGSGETALYAALSNGRDTIVQMLLDAETGADAEAELRDTPLNWMLRRYKRCRSEGVIAS